MKPTNSRLLSSKTLKVRLQSALNGFRLIDKLANQAITKNFKLYYSLSLVIRNIADLESALARFREQIVVSYAYNGADGKGEPSIPPAKQEEANAKIYEFLDSEVELPSVRGKIRLSHFQEAGVSVMSVELAMLDWLIKVDDTSTLFDEV